MTKICFGRPRHKKGQAEMKNILILSILTLVATSGLVKAQTSSPALPDYLKKLQDAGAQIQYIGNDLGLDGWMTVKDGNRQYVYVTPNQEAYMVGILLNRQGTLITADQVDRFIKSNPSYIEDQVQKHLSQGATANTTTNTSPVSQTPSSPSTNVATTNASPAPQVNNQDQAIDPTSPSEQLYATLERGNWVEIGSASAPTIYAFVDPECPHCHQFIQDLRDQGAYDANKVKTRLLPVGIMGKDSLYEAAALIEAPSPKEAFFAHLDGDEFALPVDESVSIQKVEKNMSIMQEWELDVTPFIIYRNNTGEVKIIRGRPKDMEALYRDIQ